jgi:DNA-binding transcriptional LysR family regulator
MEIRVLRYFVEAAIEESMTNAAQKLHVTQPTLSKQIKGKRIVLGRTL